MLAALAEINPPDPFELYVNASTPPRLPSLGDVCLMPFPRLWTHLRLSVRMAAHPPGVLFVPSHVIPLVHPRSVAVIHDVGFLRFPDAHPPAARRMLDVTTRWNLSASKRVIAISAATRDDLVAHYRADAGKIAVIHHGVHQKFHPRSPADIAPVLDRLGVRQPYVLAVGTVQPRKNFGGLAEAFNAVIAAGLPHRLVIAGKRGWLAERVEAEIEASGAVGRIQRLGYVDDADLPALYAGASAFCLPSLYEGFGMPVVEAMASGAPVVTSNGSALAEVAGDAALTVDPSDPAAIGAALLRVLTDESLAARLRGLGLARARQFTWRRTAEATLDVLRSVRDAR